MHSLLVTCQESICFASLHTLKVDPHTISFLPFFTGSHEMLLCDYINFTCLCCSSLKMTTWTKCSHIFWTKCPWLQPIPPSQSPICFSRFLWVLACWVYVWGQFASVPQSLPWESCFHAQPRQRGLPFCTGKAALIEVLKEDLWKKCRHLWPLGTSGS